MNGDELTVAETIERMQKVVADYREQAGQRGWHSESLEYDKLKLQLTFYEMGRNGTIPPEWAHHLMRFDPEYVEHLRLKRKFGDL